MTISPTPTTKNPPQQKQINPLGLTTSCPPTQEQKNGTQAKTDSCITDRFLHLNLVDLDAVQLVLEVVVELELVPILHVFALWDITTECQRQRKKYFGFCALTADWCQKTQLHKQREVSVYMCVCKHGSQGLGLEPNKDIITTCKDQYQIL